MTLIWAFGQGHFVQFNPDGTINHILTGVTTPSGPGEFHPEPLTDPDVNLSIHPARATR